MTNQEIIDLLHKRQANALIVAENADGRLYTQKELWELYALMLGDLADYIIKN